MYGLFVGDGTLLIHCAEIFLGVGGRVRGIVSGEARVRQWADTQGIALLGTPEAPDVGEASFDFLFSVANLTVLPESLLARAQCGAINFHDGPLPRYSGLNVTAWAILGGETRHAVTWHEMDARVDAGRILASRPVDIAPNETTFTLNAKCYEAGLETFRELVADIAADRLAPQAQEGERTWFGRARRPSNLGLLDFGASAAHLCAQVRGLDFGTFPNPLTLAKLWTGGRLAAVGRLEVLEGPASAAPGQVVAVAPKGLHVAAADHDVLLAELSDLQGDALAPTALGLAAGDTLPPLAQLDGDTLTAVGRAEPVWLATLTAAAPAEPPHPRSHGPGEGAVSVPLATALLDRDAAAAGLAAWVGRLTGQRRVSLVLDAPSPSPLLAAGRLVTLDIDPSARAGATRSAAAALIAEACEIGPMSRDLLARIKDPDARATARCAVAVAVTDVAGDDADLLGARDLTLATTPPRLIARRGLYAPDILAAMARQLGGFLADFAGRPEAALADLPIAEGDVGGRPRRVGDPFPHDLRLDAAFAAQAARTPNRPALVADDVALTFDELDRQASALAGALIQRGAGPGVVVGLCLERTADLPVAMLAILKTGAAYLPLDPGYPAERIAYMIADSETPLIVASPATAALLGLESCRVIFPGTAADPETSVPPPGEGSAEGLAYLIYTSGSTGAPKGVMVTHRNVMNFLAGMDEVAPRRDGGRLLAVTSVSFDISVLEIFWTLTRGMTVVLQTDGAGRHDRPGFSLFYFASEAAGTGHHAYRLLLEGARFADENGFEAIWTPERHFHAFGGLYPNPAVSSAAIAGLTKRVKVRGGSCVLPLHHPVRAAEDWALVDNLSAGRAGIAVASGWQPNDFILQPGNFANRKDLMLSGIDQIRALWRGESQTFPDHKGEQIEISLPIRPVNGEIPIWITAAGNPETFAAAAQKGCGVLTHLLGQTFEEVAEKIRAYRVAWREAGHPGVGTVTLMLHTFVGEDEAMVRETVREPMKGYLKSAVDLVRRASWSFPTFVERAKGSGMTPQEVFEKEALTPAETDALLDHAFERYYRSSGLFGTPESCREIVRAAASIGVDEIACLIDFGVDTDVAMANLPRIKQLMDLLDDEGGVGRRASVAEYVVEHDVTHLQCTPSLASLLVADAPGRAALKRLEALMVGGEALPLDLARMLRAETRGVLLNMYGPTETTVWSLVARLDDVAEPVPLGDPIINTEILLLMPDGAEAPDGVPGEIWIGGEGVTRGYWRRPDLTAERFVETAQGRFYRTGDLARRRPDGRIEFLGRIDNQVKIRGHRIELGEIETALAALEGVKEGVVVAHGDGAGNRRLVAYATAWPGARLEAGPLRQALGARLPEFMVPSQVVILDALPMTPNRKIDRKALPSPQAAANSGGETSTATEAIVAEIWCEALGLAKVGVTENFFDIGGHSLLVIQVQRRLKARFDRELAITDMFRFTTVRALAAHLDGAEPESRASASMRGEARAQARRARFGRHPTSISS